jgi:hypothetical protein
MSQQHLCFYSTRCRFSQTFLEELSRTPYPREFRFICVDKRPDGTRPQLPAYLKAVPTLMIRGESEPRTDSQVMNWLSERRLSDRAAVTAGRMGGPAAGGGAGGPSMGGGSGGGLAAWGDEMNTIGDESFSYIGDDTSTSKGAMVRLSGNMASLNDLNTMTVPDARVHGSSSGVMTGPGTAGPTARQSAKSKALDDAFEAYRASRDRDVPGPVQRK